MAKALVKDHGLLESEIRETNLNRFMSHIGELWTNNGWLQQRMLTQLVHIGVQFSLIAIPVLKKDD
jgi:hypothetical protein